MVVFMRVESSYRLVGVAVLALLGAPGCSGPERFGEDGDFAFSAEFIRSTEGEWDNLSRESKYKAMGTFLEAKPAVVAALDDFLSDLNEAQRDLVGAVIGKAVLPYLKELALTGNAEYETMRAPCKSNSMLGLMSAVVTEENRGGEVQIAMQLFKLSQLMDALTEGGRFEEGKWQPESRRFKATGELIDDDIEPTSYEALKTHLLGGIALLEQRFD